MHTLSYYHAMYFPRRFEETYRRGLLLERDEEVVRWQRTLRRYVGKMSALGAGRPLLLKNPGYTAQIRAIRALWPDARFVHIYRDPYVVFESTRRALAHGSARAGLAAPRACPGRRGRARDVPADDEPPARGGGPPASHAIVHVRFEELERDPLGEVERIYRSLRLGDYEAARPRIEAYLRSIQDYSKSTYTFSKESVGRVTQRWQPFVTRFGYRPPDLERCAA